MKHIYAILFKHFYNKDISLEERKEIEGHILSRNWVRAKVVFLLMFFSELVLILVVDFPILRSGAPSIEEVDYWYFMSHLLIAGYSAIGYIVTRYFEKKTNRENLRLEEGILYTMAFVLLCMLTAINSFDQLTTDQITVFVIYVILSGFVLLIKPGVDILFYLLIYGIFATGIFLYQDDPILVNSHIVNGGFMVVGAITVAKMTYFNYYRLYAKTYDLNKVNKELDYLSKHDELTGLANRRYFHEQLVSLRNPGGWMFLIDLDDFKKVNDQFGHQAGDMVLVEIAKILQSFWEYDLLISRYGGEEFMVYVPNQNDEFVLSLANEIRQKVKKSSFDGLGYDIIVTISVGVSQYNGQKKDAFDQSYSRADRALYKAKKQGKDQVVEFE